MNMWIYEKIPFESI